MFNVVLVDVYSNNNYKYSDPMVTIIVMTFVSIPYIFGNEQNVHL